MFLLLYRETLTHKIFKILCERLVDMEKLNLQSRLNRQQMSNPGSSEEIFDGSLNAVLNDNVGFFVICEFLVGTNNLVRRQGILHCVGLNYFVLHQEDEETYIACDMFSLKFITFYNSKTKPRNVRL